MKIYTSYFYQVRFFTPNMIPLSTAIWPPKWFGSTPYRDKNGVWNGISAPPFAPTEVEEGSCHGQPCMYSPDLCLFLRSYRKQLDKLDFEDIMRRMRLLAENIQKTTGFEEEPIIVLMVHEAKDNPCSERIPIQQWFASHGVEVKEWLP